MDICENLLNMPDFTPSETETELSINGCVIPELDSRSDVTAGREQHKMPGVFSYFLIIIWELAVNIYTLFFFLSYTEPLTVGSRLLLPHIPAVLQYLGGVVRNSDRLKKKKFRAQVSKELNILSKYALALLAYSLWFMLLDYKQA